MNEPLIIRPATEQDVPLILDFIRQLADYEKLSDEVTATEETLRRNLFSGRKTAEVLLAFAGSQPAGFAVFFHNFSTFLGKPGIYLEDLFVSPARRRRGCAKALMVYLARLAVERGCGRFEWSVLDWNEPALKLYRSLGAVGMNEWTVQRLVGEPLARLVAQPLPGEVPR